MVQTEIENERYVDADRFRSKGGGGLPEEQIRALREWIGKGAQNDRAALGLVVYVIVPRRGVRRHAHELPGAEPVMVRHWAGIDAFAQRAEIALPAPREGSGDGRKRKGGQIAVMWGHEGFLREAVGMRRV